ncbi:MAG TPA: DUF3352 domain-containing protein [Ktedonobacterales bacterium]|nr:DUF3352 domain-containing protein [Ktedonobacterales bacterium]
MDAGQQSPAPGVCPGCGQSLDAQAVYCPVCGRPNPALTVATSAPAQDDAYATAQAQASDATMPPPLPTWADQPTTTSGSGFASLAAGPTVTPNQPIRSHKRRNVLTVVAALVIIGLIGSGAYWAYAAFASRTDSQLARYFPSNTVAYASVDLMAASSNNYKINPADLVGQQASALQKATGLDWQKDVVPWVGRDIALGVFPLGSAQTGQAVTDPASAVGVSVLVQSRDDNAAKAAITKMNAHLKQEGSSVQSSTYKGFTLYGPANTSSPSSGAYGAGSGWVVIASNSNAAHAVIDRINGNGDTLSDQQPFKDAISNAPSNNFGTYYVNLRQALNTIVPVRAPNGLASVSVPFIETYPVAGGYASWTNTGERSQLTFNAVRNPNIPDVSGDTTSFAALTPADAVAYAGVANVGKLIQASLSQVGTLAAGNDPLKSALGISASDPLAQQPAGVAALQAKNGPAQSVFFVHVSSDTAATQLISDIASAQHWTAKPTTISGQPATAFYTSEVGDQTYDVPPTPAANGAPPAPPVTGTATASLRQIGVALTLKNTLVIAPDNDTAALIAQVAQGGASNLASNATFQNATKAAPSGAAATAYVSAAALKQMAPASDTASIGADAVFSHFDALALTLVWNNSVLQGTLDAQLHA